MTSIATVFAALLALTAAACNADDKTAQKDSNPQ
jgi:uncharacterized lipoprotein